MTTPAAASNAATSNNQKVLPHTPGRLIALGVAMFILGLLAMILPTAMGVGVAIVVGILLLIAGVAQLSAGIHAPSLGAGLLNGLFGFLMFIAGLFMLLRPQLGLVKLTLIAAIYFVVVGIAEIIVSFRVKPRVGWGMILLNGIVTLILGGLIWSEWPYSAEWAVGVLVGVQLLFMGAHFIALGSAAKQLARAA